MIKRFNTDLLEQTNGYVIITSEVLEVTNKVEEQLEFGINAEGHGKLSTANVHFANALELIKQIGAGQ